MEPKGSLSEGTQISLCSSKVSLYLPYLVYFNIAESETGYFFSYNSDISKLQGNPEETH